VSRIGLPRPHDLPVAWRADPSPSHRGPTLRVLPDLHRDLAPQPPALARPPVIRNAFIGRDAQLREVVRRLSLPDGRLVTIVGRSGVGKTRLALEAARRLGASFPGGIALVDCAVPDVRPMVDRVSAALGIRVAQGQQPRDAIERRLHHAPVLLLADDVDLDPDGLDALLELLAGVPSARVLATAQRATGHGEEHVVRLRPLTVPASDADPAAIRAAPAVALYLARAAAVQPGFATTHDDLPAIAELCRRLDGLPLAIELGAARARLLPPTGQVEALDRGDPLALRAPRGDRRPARHQELRRALEVTWAMTEPPERAVLRRMAVFSVPPTLDLLSAVAADPGWSTDDLLDALGSLVDLGLVEPEEAPGEPPRYRLLPTVRALGLERLREAGEDEAVGRAYERACLERARHSLALPDARRASALARDAADLAIVLDRFEAAGELEQALELASILVWLWIRVGVSPAVRQTHDRVVAGAEAAGEAVSPAILARGLVSAAVLRITGPMVEDARAHAGPQLERAMALARAAGDEQALLLALEWTAVSVVVTGDVALAATANAEGLALAARLGDEVALARFEYRASMFAGLAGDTAAMVSLGASALRHAAANDDPESYVRTAMHLSWLPAGTPGLPSDLPSPEAAVEVARANGLLFEEGSAYAILAVRSLLRGDAAAAARWCGDGLAFATRYGAWHSATYHLVALLLAASASGDQVTVARLHGVLLPVMPEAIRGQVPVTRPMFAAAIARARETLGEAGFATEEAATSHLDRVAAIDWASGVARRLAEPQAVVDAGVGPGAGAGTAPAAPDSPPAAGLDRLTPREVQVLEGLTRGLTNREIGEALGLSAKTVMHHSVSIYAKLGVRGRADAAAWATANGVGERGRPG
jgi:predicted ATPase/DNA-binding CsgD family transcriptional regulator